MLTDHAVVSALIESATDLTDPVWLRHADAFMAQAIEFGVDARFYVGGPEWKAILCDYLGDEGPGPIVELLNEDDHSFRIEGLSVVLVSDDGTDVEISNRNGDWVISPRDGRNVDIATTDDPQDAIDQALQFRKES